MNLQRWFSVHRWGVFVAVASIVFVVDQLTKTIVRATLAPGQGVRALGSFSIQHFSNPGISGGQVDRGALPLTIVAMVAVGIMLLFLARWGLAGPLALIGFGLLVGGGLGNLFDRVSVGGVTDFIRSGDSAFNLADVAVFTGSAVVLAAVIVALKGGGPAAAQADGLESPRRD